MNASTSFKLFELTKEFIKDKAKARSFVEIIEATMEDKMDQKLQQLATKEDLFLLRTELMDAITNQKVDLMEVITNQKSELMEVIGKQKVDLMEVITNQKSALTKSIYFVGLVQFLAIIGCLIGILNFYNA
jgi:hypothetical protein